MRLIDADAENERLLDFIAQNDSGIQYAIEYKDMTMLEDIFFDYFDGQPTAYDVDKVVEQLESQKSGLTTWAEDEAYKLGIEKAIEIVKSGGIE